MRHPYPQSLAAGIASEDKRLLVPMNKYLLSGLCLLAFNHAQADGTLTLPTGTITAPAVDEDHIDLKTPTTAGSRLGLTALETPASTDSLSGEQIREHGDISVQDAASSSAG